MGDKMHLLTFLGLGSRDKNGELTGYYNLAKYKWQNSEPIETCWIAEACVEIFDIRKIFVVATEKALSTTWPNLQKAISDKCKIEAIRIGDGNSEKELWEMFDAIVKPIPEECKLVIDITHGFRSQPMIALAIAIYLTRVRNVSIKHIVYGAFEAIDAETKIVPIFELKPFLDFIDWTFAISQFNKSGSADLLKAIMQKSKRNEKDQLGLIAADLESTSRALHLLRPKETHKNALKTAAHLKSAREKIQTNMKARPFLPLVDEVEKTLQEFATDYREQDAIKILQTHLKMISWYLEKEKYIQAICLAREWFVRFHAHHMGLDCTKKRFREQADHQLARIIKDEEDKSNLHPNFPVELYKKICDTRNQVAHANDEYSSETLIRKIEDSCSELIKIGNQLYPSME